MLRCDGVRATRERTERAAEERRTGRDGREGQRRAQGRGEHRARERTSKERRQDSVESVIKIITNKFGRDDRIVTAICLVATRALILPYSNLPRGTRTKRPRTELFGPSHC